MPTVSVCYALQSVPENINIKKKKFTTNHLVLVQYTKYDGLKVYNNRSASECLKPQSIPSPPRGYHRDYAIYLRYGPV
jgi:hypothetical protein